VIANPFVLRSIQPPPSACEGRRVAGLRRARQAHRHRSRRRLWIVIHLMIAGRLHWHPPAHAAETAALAALEFDAGTLTLTEAGSKRRASLHVVAAARRSASTSPAGIDVFTATADEFATQLTQANHTLKRALTDPACSAASATRTRTRSCTTRGSHRSH
jgi:formamidopyrimidine-DNA glycosylase